MQSYKLLVMCVNVIIYSVYALLYRLIEWDFCSQFYKFDIHW